MTGKKMLSLLNRLDLKANEMIQTPEIRTLFLTTNQGIDYHRDFIYFDTANEMIKIKQYKANGAAGRINEHFDLSADKKTLSSLGKIYYTHPKYQFRRILPGDKLFILNRADGSIEKTTYTVESAGQYQIRIDKELIFNKDTQVLCYSEDGNMVQDLVDKSLFLKYTPYTNNKFDIYLDMNALLGIELQSKLAGNS